MSKLHRREFVLTLGAAALAPTLSRPQALDTPAPVTVAPRSRIELGGSWQRFIDGHTYDSVTVPSSLRPSGIYTLTRDVVVPKLSSGQRAFLHFDGITYAAHVSLNGVALGSMGPYVPGEFELTRHLKEGANNVSVEIADLIPFPDRFGKDELALGVNPGWEAYGGIIRDVYVELRSSSFIDNVRFAYKLAPDFQAASCHARIFVQATTNISANIEFSLARESAQVAHTSKDVRLTAGLNEIDLDFDLDKPPLWSPDTPRLYTMDVRMSGDGGHDQWSGRTGFRDLKAMGREFHLNGAPFTLKGVCRHDMWKDQGFTLTRAQQRQDMHTIKALGCNFVRLVHYPHDRNVIELADELGLFVTEEPGYWIMDFSKMPRGQIELGYRILESTIRRDWNSPSVFGWILSNESTLTVDTLAEGKRRCNELDPWQRFVSAANSHPKEEVKAIYEKAGMDFFDQHPYTFDLDQFESEADYFGAGKPLTFTEWGGKEIAQSRAVMSETVDRLLELTRAGKLAGHSFWSWQDLRQYSRIDHEMRDGVLESGVVTEGRQIRDPIYMELARLFAGGSHEEEHPEPRPEILPLRRVAWSVGATFKPVDLASVVTGPQGLLAWAAFEASLASYWASLPFSNDQWKRTGGKFQLWAQGQRDLAVSGMPFRISLVQGFARPVIVSRSLPCTIPILQPCSRIHVLGHVTFASDYQVIHSVGRVLGTLALQFRSGRAKTIPLRNGYEVARANQIDVATRTDTPSLDAQPALRFQKDVAREDYQFLLYSASVPPNDPVDHLSYTMADEHTSLAILGITTEA